MRQRRKRRYCTAAESADAVWLRSQTRKQAMQLWHLPEYSRKHGFPSQCRPIGNSDFECP
jgi:hypothetical protein